MYGSQQNGQKKAGGGWEDNAFDMAIFLVIGVVLLFIASVAVPSLILGYFLYWAWNDKAERQLARTTLVFAFWVIGVFYLAGLPQYDTVQTVTKSFWPGALFTSYADWTGQAYGWCYRNLLHFLKFDSRELVNQIRFLAYAPVLGGLVALAGLTIFHPKRNSPSVYQAFRDVVVFCLSPYVQLADALIEWQGTKLGSYLGMFAATVLPAMIGAGVDYLTGYFFLMDLLFVTGVIGYLYSMYVVWGGSEGRPEMRKEDLR